MISAMLSLLLAYSVTSAPDEFAEVNDLPAPSTAPADELVRYEQLDVIAKARESEEEWWYEPQYQEYGVTAYYSASNDAFSAEDGVTAAEFQWRGVVED